MFLSPEILTCSESTPGGRMIDTYLSPHNTGVAEAMKTSSRTWHKAGVNDSQMHY